MPTRFLYEELKDRVSEINKVLDHELAVKGEARDSSLYSEIVQNIPVGVYRVLSQPPGIFVMANPAISKLLGYESPEEFLQTSLNDHFLDPKEYDALLEKAIAGDGAVSGETQLKRRDGNVFWGAITLQPVQDRFGKIRYLDGTVKDITSRKRAEQQLAQEKVFSEAVIESLPGLFFMLDEDHLYVKWNKNAEKTYGYTLEEMSALGVEKVVAPQDVATILSSFKRAWRGERGYAEYHIIAKDGSKIPLAGEACRITIDGKNFLVGMEINISKRKKVEKRLKSALAELRDLKNQLQAENYYLLEQINQEQGFDKIIGQSDALNQVLVKVHHVAPTNSTVLILGETGVGKELVARAIHHLSPRKGRSLVKVNCASLPPSLIESELFGHEKGAFTGAVARRPGRFEMASGSTLFLDEITELPLDLQVKLLRVVEDREVERLGGNRSVKVDVRIIAATNRSLEEEVQKGRFREDLWYRINVFPINVPPLRERKADIPLLTHYFVNKFSKETGKSIDRIPQETIETLQQYSWPGNVRELKNAIERSVISNSGPTLRLPDEVKMLKDDLKSRSGKTLAEVEREHIIETLDETDWRISGPKGAAAILGLHPSTLRGRMRKLGIRRGNVVPRF